MLPTRSVDDVLALIDARFTALPTEEVASADALGRVLAADAIAARDGDKAEQLARAHIREALRCRLKLLQKQ